jgi:hypothetical protein
MKITRCNLKLLKEYEKETETIMQMRKSKIKIAEEKYKDENMSNSHKTCIYICL